MTTRLLTEGDVERGHPPDLTMVVDAYSWSRVPGTDVEVWAFTDKPSRYGTGPPGGLLRRGMMGSAE